VPREQVRTAIMSIDLTLPDDLKRDISLAAEILLNEGCKEVYIGKSTSSVWTTTRISAAA
jgi:hypothetical protein